MNFKKYILKEEFDQTPLIKFAQRWLADKFQNKPLTFEHKPKLIETGNGKRFNCSIDGNSFGLYVIKHDTEYNKTDNVALFKITPIEEEEEDEL